MAKRRDTTAIETSYPEGLARLARALDNLPGVTANPDGTVDDPQVVAVFELAAQIFDTEFLIVQAHVYLCAGNRWLVGDLDRALALLRAKAAES
ncbi:MAG: hypothetical protein IT295_10270 [Dehalococcoidia bacterium]|nr:hypothetical protein [Dehalococcoidia bacterium]